MASTKKSIIPLSEELIRRPLFNSEYMVYFTPDQAEGPYNDVYLYCYIKHGLIHKDTIVVKNDEESFQMAGECDDLSRFFREFDNVLP